jgi:shikimate kinase
VQLARSLARGGRLVHLIGPGGAGKSTVAPLLATLLGVPSADLDAHFTTAHGCVDAFIPDVHPRYAAFRAALAAAPTTVVLLPALELEACVAETVRRQVSRGAGRTTAERAEAKIRERFAQYAALPARKVTTARPPDGVPVAIATLLLG